SPPVRGHRLDHLGLLRGHAVPSSGLASAPRARDAVLRARSPARSVGESGAPRNRSRDAAGLAPSPIRHASVITPQGAAGILAARAAHAPALERPEAPRA